MSTRLVKTWILVVAVMFLSAAAFPAVACEKLVTIPRSDIEALEKMLKDPGSSESKRLLAFQELSCSDMPNIRTMTLDAGFASSNKILQSEALTTLLMQRDQIRIELFEDARTNSGGKQFIQSHSGSLPYIFYERDRVRNCINLHQGEKDCTRGALTIDGLNVRLKDLDWTGTFALQPERILKGTIIHTNQLIGAKIDLTQ